MILYHVKVLCLLKTGHSHFLQAECHESPHSSIILILGIAFQLWFTCACTLTYFVIRTFRGIKSPRAKTKNLAGSQNFHPSNFTTHEVNKKRQDQSSSALTNNILSFLYSQKNLSVNSCNQPAHGYHTSTLPPANSGTLLLHISPPTLCPPVPYPCRRTGKGTQHLLGALLCKVLASICLLQNLRTETVWLFQAQFISAEEKKLSWPIFLLFPDTEMYIHIPNFQTEKTFQSTF